MDATDRKEPRYLQTGMFFEPVSAYKERPRISRTKSLFRTTSPPNVPKKRFSSKDILFATSNFSNPITKDALGNKVYQGQLSWNRDVMYFTVRRLNCTYGIEDEMQTEISTLRGLKHKNIISILGHHDDNNEKIIIYEQAVHGTLDNHLSNSNLTWSQRLQICLGVARALDYIHYDIIHCDISSSKIFLNEDWEPKIYGFELSTKYPQSWKHRLLYSRHFKTNNMTPKYDVYSFGVLLGEVLYGKELMITNNVIKEELDEIIDPILKKQMVPQSLELFKRIANKCLNQQLVQRPTMDQVVKELEEVLELQWKHANHEHSKAADEGTSSPNLKMEFLKIPLSKIMEATENFKETYYVGSGGYGKVYKAKLDVLDIQWLSSMEGKCKDELPKINKTVAIKRIFRRADEQDKQGFLRELELLTSCRHPNIVSLLGFSEEDNELILVYEYALKGSLNDYLGNKGRANNLTWAQRIQICLDIAQGINYLHTNKEGKPRILHRDIKSENILLDENMKAMVTDFGLSKFQQTSTGHTNNIVGTRVYMDPEYVTKYKYKRESDIYSFGVVLFEVLSGSLAYDKIYIDENEMGLAPIARRHYNEGTLKELIDLKIIEEYDDHTFTLNRGPNEDSFKAFSKIAYQCVAETQARRPTMDVVIEELQNVLNLQGETVVLLRFRLSDILLATKNFAEKYCISLDTNSKLYKAEVDHFGNNSSQATEGKYNGEQSMKHITVIIKRITSTEGVKGKKGFFSELEMSISYKHPNIVSLIGFCDESGEMILVYEHASKSLNDYQRDSKEGLLKKLQLSCKDIEFATENFSEKNCVGSGRSWKAYKGELPFPQDNANANGRTTIVAKRWDSKFDQADHQFRTEFNILFKGNHENVIAIIGYCNEMDEKIIVYEHMSKGSLDRYLKDTNLTWMKRLEICIDVASGLEFLHQGDLTLKKVIHRDIKSASILLNDDWKAKVSNLELSSIDSLKQDMKHATDNAYATLGYLDPQYNQGFLTEKSDIYSFGVVLYEILCGRMAWTEDCMDHSQSLGPLAKRCYEEQKLDEIVFDGIKEKIGPESLTTFADIAYQCLHDKGEERPTAHDVVIQLKKALDVQKDHEKCETELPEYYKEIIRMSKTPEIYSTANRKDLYDALSKGILIQQDKVLFSLGSNGEGNAMVSASQFSYENHWSHKWHSIPESRFDKVAEMLDISNLNIQIKIRSQFLSSGVDYGVHLVFKYRDERKSMAKPMYVNLTYKMGDETLHAYFATWREDEWMTIELYRFLNHNESNNTTDFEFLLKSFSQCYNENRAIYVEGVEFRAIDNGKPEENNLMEVQQVNMGLMQQSQTNNIPSDTFRMKTLLKLFRRRNKNKKCYMISAKKALCDSFNANLYNLKPSTESIFQKVAELSSTQVFRITCKIENRMLLQNIEYGCYLVFKLSEQSCELHCPVKVHDLHQSTNTHTKVVYFRHPRERWNIDAVNQVPQEREDGWMEVYVWKFKSNYELQNERISISLEFASYEGTMSGLIVRGLELRPM